MINIGLVSLIFFFPISAAHAYLDPGTGSIIVQVILAAFFGSIFFLKSAWLKAINFVKGIFGKKP